MLEVVGHPGTFVLLFYEYYELNSSEVFEWVIESFTQNFFFFNRLQELKFCQNL